MTALIQKGMNNAQNAEFQNLKLAQIYEFFNQFSEDEDFWLRTVKELNISDITDFGCGTWLLTHKLMELWYSIRWLEPAWAILEQARKKNEVRKSTISNKIIENLNDSQLNSSWWRVM